MKTEKEIFELQYYKEHLASFRIQQYYLRAKYNPDYAFCKKRHTQFYNEYINDIYELVKLTQ